MGTDPFDNCANNSSHAAWPPDFNNDRLVSLADVMAVITNFGSRTNLRYDLNGDNLVSLADVNEVIRYFGLRCS